MNKPRIDQGPDYERGFIDGMQYQMQSSVDKAVNRMAQTNAYDNMLKAIDSMRPAARVIQDKPATWWLDEFEKVVRNLKEKNT